MGEHMIDVNSLVRNHYHGIVRYGTVTKRMIKDDGWAYFKVDWHHDEDYSEAIAWRKEMSGKEHLVEEYRGDMLSVVRNPRQVALAIEAHYNFLQVKYLTEPKGELKLCVGQLQDDS